MRGFRGALNWTHIMRRDAILAVSFCSRAPLNEQQHLIDFRFSESLASLCNHLYPIEDTHLVLRILQSTIVLRGLREAFNWSPIIRSDAILAVNFSRRTPLNKQHHWDIHLSERLAPLGSHLCSSQDTRETPWYYRALSYWGGFTGALNSTPIMPRDVILVVNFPSSPGVELRPTQRGNSITWSPYISPKSPTQNPALSHYLIFHINVFSMYQ